LLALSLPEGEIPESVRKSGMKWLRICTASVTIGCNPRWDPVGVEVQGRVASTEKRFMADGPGRLGAVKRP
jgi:hypothetical protein